MSTHEVGHKATAERIAHLRGVAVFADLKDKAGALESIARVMKNRSFNEGDAIITEGDTVGSEMFVLIKGQASIYKTTAEGDLYKVAVVHGKSNACFGEGGLLGGDARSATIRADSHCECLVLDRPAFEAFCDENPKWAIPVILRITHSVMNRLKNANTDLMMLYHALVAEIRG